MLSAIAAIRRSTGDAICQSRMVASPIGGNLQITDQHGGGPISTAYAKPLGRVLNNLFFHVIRPLESLRQRLQSQFKVDDTQMLVVEV